MSSEIIANLTTMMETFRIALLLLIPIYGISFGAVLYAREIDVDWISELYFLYPKLAIANPMLMTMLVPLFVVVWLVHPLWLFLGIFVSLIVFIALLIEENMDFDESSIDRDLRGVVLKCDKKNVPKQPVRLEKITAEKEYVESGEIDIDTNVEWKWDIKNVKKAGELLTSKITEKLLSGSESTNIGIPTADSESDSRILEPEISIETDGEKISSDDTAAVEDDINIKHTESGKKDVGIKDSGASMINSISNVKFYRKPLIDLEEEYTIFNMDLQEKHCTIPGGLLQQLVDYTGKWDETFNNHDMYFVSGIDPYNEHELSSELVTFIKEVLEQDDEVQLRWVYRTPL